MREAREARQYSVRMEELLTALANVGAYVLLFGLLAWALYLAFGPQVFGVQVLMAILVIVAGVRVFSNAGLAGLAFVVVGVAALIVVIGMAMAVAAKGAIPPDEKRPAARSDSDGY